MGSPTHWRSEQRGDTLLWELSPRSDLLSPVNQPTAAAIAEADVFPCYHLLRRRRSGPVGNPGTALLHYDSCSRSGTPSGGPTIGWAIGRTRLSVVWTSRGVEPSPHLLLSSRCCPQIGLWLDSPCNTHFGKPDQLVASELYSNWNLTWLL